MTRHAGSTPANTPLPYARKRILKAPAASTAGTSASHAATPAADPEGSDPSDSSTSDDDGSHAAERKVARLGRRYVEDQRGSPGPTFSLPAPLDSLHGPFRTLLNYRRYLVRNTDLRFAASQARQLRRRHRLLDPHFNGVPGFDDAEPLATLALLTSFRSAADEMGVSMGEAPYLLAYRLCGDAKDDLIQETTGPHASPVGTSFPHMLNYLLRRYAPEDALHKAELELRNAAQREDEGERAFYHRLLRLGRALMGMYDPDQLRYLYLHGLHPSVQAAAEVKDRSCSSTDELVALAQNLGDGLRAARPSPGSAERYAKTKAAINSGGPSGDGKTTPVL